MTDLLFWLGPLFLGVLIGWLLKRWLSRQSKSAADSEKDAEIARLKTELERFRRQPPLLQPPAQPAAANHDSQAQLLARIRELESEVALIPGLQAQLAAVQAGQPQAAGHRETTAVESPNDDRENVTWRARCAELEQQVHDQARSLAARDQEIRMLRQDPAIDIQAANLAGFHSVQGANDLDIIKGIAPATVELLRNHGIYSFAELARTSPAQIQAMIERSVPNFRPTHIDTWPEQAALASRNLWRPLKVMQDTLAEDRLAASAPSAA